VEASQQRKQLSELIFCQHQGRQRWRLSCFLTNAVAQFPAAGCPDNSLGRRSPFPVSRLLGSCRLQNLGADFYRELDRAGNEAETMSLMVQGERFGLIVARTQQTLSAKGS
jgi:hypothetical protein